MESKLTPIASGSKGLEGFALTGSRGEIVSPLPDHPPPRGNIQGWLVGITYLTEGAIVLRGQEGREGQLGRADVSDFLRFGIKGGEKTRGTRLFPSYIRR